MHAKKTTLAIASVSSTHQLPVALSMAARVLRVAGSINNTPRLALFGSGISDARPSSVKNVSMLKTIAGQGWRDASGLEIKDVNVVVGANDLAILRLVPSRVLGEVCDVPPCEAALCSVPPNTADLQRKTVEETIDCLLREPPVEYKYESDLPFEWQEHKDNMSGFRWVRDLWKQSLKDMEKSEKSDTKPVDGEVDSAIPSPFDVLSLCMYCKVASVAFRTTDMTKEVIKSIVVSVEGAADVGLLSIFPKDGVAPPFLGFIEQFLIGDEYPWQVTPRGSIAAAKARLVLKRTFDHTSTVASVLSKSDIALEFGDHVGPEEERSQDRILLVQGGPRGDVARMIYNSLPSKAVASNGQFEVVSAKAPVGTWPRTLNEQFREVVDALLSSDEKTAAVAATLRNRLAAYTAISSRFLDKEAGSQSSSTSISSLAKNLVSTYPRSAASHISRDLMIRDSLVLIGATMANVSVQQGTSVACTFVTFCPTMSKTLSSSPFKTVSVSGTNISEDHRKVQAIAASMSGPSAPLGMFTGTLGGIIEFEGSEYRLACWKRDPMGDDEFVTLLPSAYVNVAFADYATGSRALDPEELSQHSKFPFFASDTVMTLFESTALAHSNRLAYRIPNASKLPLLGNDETALYDAYNSSLRSGARKGKQLKLPTELAGGMTSFLVRESGNDRLTGLKVAWATRLLAGQRVAMLVSNNSSAERVSF
jgi:hypothetical protein